MPAALRRLAIGDDPDSWAAAGFDVREGTVSLGRVVVDLIGTDGGRGVRGWMLQGVVDDIDGLPTVLSPEHETPTPQSHRNQVFAIDHIVIESDDMERTVPAFEAHGLQERKSQLFERKGSAMRQSFFWAGRTIVEVVGPTKALDEGSGTSRFWGLALVSEELADTVALLGDKISEPRPAVQPDRQIATVRTDAFGISVPIAVMSPHISAEGL